MALDLTSVRAKLARAQEHRQTIKNEITAWIDRNPYSIIHQTNANSTRYSIILRINEPPPFLRWTLIMGDCVSNMRASLDHLIFAIACHEAAPNPPANEGVLMFPIADSRANFDEAVSKGRLGKISEPVRAAVEAMQPYNRLHPDLPPLLSMIRNLNNTDKHKLLRLAYAAPARGEFGFTGDSVNAGNWQTVVNPAEIEDGTEVLAMVCDRPAPNMKFDKTILDVVVTIWHGKRDPAAPEWTGRNEVGALTKLMLEEVRKTIYGVSAVVK